MTKLTDLLPTGVEETPKPERWLIVATTLGYMLGQVVREFGDGVTQLDMGPDAPLPLVVVHSDMVVAEHHSEFMGRLSLARAKQVEASYRPFWQITVRAELEARAIMNEAARAAAQ